MIGPGSLRKPFIKLEISNTASKEKMSSTAHSNVQECISGIAEV